MAVIPRLVFAFLALAALVFFSPVIVVAQTTPASPAVKRDIARPIQSMQGVDIYKEYCAVCHGVDLKGLGPAAPAMKVPPTDLTAFAAPAGSSPMQTCAW
jgi:mono/diheme cytochrome c family protein